MKCQGKVLEDVTAKNECVEPGGMVWKVWGMEGTRKGINFSFINSAKVVSLHFVLCPQQYLPVQNILYQGTSIIFLKRTSSDIATSL